MIGLLRRYLIVAVLVFLTAFVVKSLGYDSEQDNIAGSVAIQRLPLKFGEWNGYNVLLEDRVYEILETRAIIHRSFNSPQGDNVFLSIVHYQDTKVDFHAPEACIGGRGLKTKKTTKLMTLFSGLAEIKLECAELITTRENGQTLSYYFYKAGSYVGSNYVALRFNIAINKLVDSTSSSSLVRVSTPIIAGDKERASKLLIGFIQDIFSELQETL